MSLTSSGRLLTTWCISQGKIPETQFGLYPGRNTLLPIMMLILRRLQHAAHTISAGVGSQTTPGCIQPLLTSNRFMALSPGRISGLASIPNTCLYHFSLPFHACMLATNTSNRTRTGCKTRMPFFFIAFLLVNNYFSMIAEGLQGAVCVLVSNILFVDDLTLLAKNLCVGLARSVLS